MSYRKEAEQLAWAGIDCEKAADEIELAIERAIDAEREAIAKMVEESEVFCEHGCTARIAAAIRERKP